MRFNNQKLRDKFLQDLNIRYGKPKYSFYIISEFDIMSFEWVLKDRTIQIETSTGMSAEFSSENKFKSGTYYRVDLLLIENNYKNRIYKAHIFNVPEKILYNNKLYSYKEFQYEKIMTIKDEFLLNSTNNTYITNDNNIYSINNYRKED